VQKIGFESVGEGKSVRLLGKPVELSSLKFGTDTHSAADDAVVETE
jgi:hypothetical protein